MLAERSAPIESSMAVVSGGPYTCGLTERMPEVFYCYS